MATDFGAYARVLRTPRALPFVIAGALSRFPRSTLSLCVILLVSSTFGSFTAAGATTGVLVAGMAIAAPFWSSRMDRHGQRGVLAIALVCMLAATSFLAVLALVEAPLPWWLVAAGLVGLTSPDIPSAVRARWTGLVDGRERTTAFAVETIVDQTVFVTGPPIVTLLAAAAHPLLGLAFAVVFGVAGAAWLIAQRSTEPEIVERTGPRRIAILPPPGVLPIAIACAGLGAMFGAFDVSSVAWSEYLGEPWLAGIAMAILAVGIAIGSVVVGARVSKRPAVGRFLTFLGVGAIGFGLLPLVAEGPWLMAVVPVAGLLVSPVMVTGIAIVASRAPRDRLTESLAYPTAGMSIGLPVGATFAGASFDAAGPAAGFLTCALALTAAFVIAAVGEGIRSLRLVAAPPSDRPVV